jgi:hypothetical protein
MCAQIGCGFVRLWDPEELIQGQPMSLPGGRNNHGLPAEMQNSQFGGSFVTGGSDRRDKTARCLA